MNSRAALSTVSAMVFAFLPAPAPAETGQEDHLSPEYIQLLQEAGTAFQQDKFDEVLDKLDRMDAIRLDTPVALNLRGAVFTELKEFDKARGMFQKALEEEPGYFAPLFNLGEILFLEKKYAESRGHFERILGENPGAELLQYKIFLTYLMEEDLEKAETWRDKIKFPSDTPAYYFARAAWEFKKDDPDEAASWIQESMRIFGPPANDFFMRSLLDVGFLSRQDAEAPAAPGGDSIP